MMSRRWGHLAEGGSWTGDRWWRVIVTASGAAAGWRIVTSAGARGWRVVLTVAMVWVGGAWYKDRIVPQWQLHLTKGGGCEMIHIKSQHGFYKKSHVTHSLWHSNICYQQTEVFSNCSTLSRNSYNTRSSVSHHFSFEWVHEAKKLGIQPDATNCVCSCDMMSHLLNQSRSTALQLTSGHYITFI